MNQQLNNLYNELKNIPLVANCYEYYDYIKIDTICSIEYCHEFLTLYAKQNENDILISDLNDILELADYYKIPDETVMELANKNNLNFDGVSVFKNTTIAELSNTIQSFFKLIKLLNL